MPDIFDLLDESLDNLADLEKFEPHKAGSHLMSISWKREEFNGMPAINLELTLVETLELTNKSDEPDQPGKKVGIKFFLKFKDKETGEVKPNKVGQGQLKEVLKVLSEVFGGTTPNEMMEASEGATAAFTLKIRKDKNDPDIQNNTIKAVQNV